VTYHLERNPDRNLHDTLFSVIATRRTPERGGSGLAEVAALKVQGGAILEKIVEDFPTAPPRRGGRARRAHVSKLLRFLASTIIASFDLTRDLRRIEWFTTSHGFDRLGNERLSLRRLSRFLLPDLEGHELERVAAFFKVRLTPEEGAASRAEAAADVLIELLRMTGEKGIDSLPDLRAAIDESRETIEWDRYAFDRNLIAYLPPSPGVYMMKDREGRVIYVGKALSLRERVATYFTGREEERIRGLREKVFDIECEKTGTALMALLREAELITVLRPQFNTVLAREAWEKRRGCGGKTRSAADEKSRESGERSPSGHRERPGKTAGKLLFLPRPAKEEIDLILLMKGRPLWKGILATDLSNLSEVLEQLTMFLSTPRVGTPDRSEELEVSLVESWLSRNEDSVNLIELCGGEDREALERMIRPLVESGDWRGEKVVYRM
jgi:hypothetical protein